MNQSHLCHLAGARIIIRDVKSMAVTCRGQSKGATLLQHNTSASTRVAFRSKHHVIDKGKEVTQIIRIDLVVGYDVILRVLNPEQQISKSLSPFESTHNKSFF